MISSSSEILLLLLRAALGNEGAGGSARLEGLDLGSVSGEVWKKVIDLSFEQGVAALSVDGLGLMVDGRGFANDGSTSSPQDNDTLRYDNDNQDGVELSLDSPELEDLKYEWFGATFQTEEDYDRNNKAVLKLREESLELRGGFVVLKGLAIARKYPVPEHRASVDLDIFGLRGESLELRDVEIIRDDYKHTGFMYQGVMVEYHKSLIAWKSLRNGRFIEKTLRDVLRGEGFGSTGSPTELREGMFASDYFNALFAAVHSYTHFMLEDGISLKHIIDWQLIFNENENENENEDENLKERVLATLESFGMREFAESMSRVAEYVCKDPSTSLTRTDSRMLDDILALGQKKRFKNGHLNMAYNILICNGWKFRAFAKESNVACLVRCAWNAIMK